MADKIATTTNFNRDYCQSYVFFFVVVYVSLLVVYIIQSQLFEMQIFLQIVVKFYFIFQCCSEHLRALQHFQ